MSTNNQLEAEHVKGTALNLGDRVRLSCVTFCDAVVIHVDAETVTLFRPYATTASFSCGNTVIPYIGIEQFKCSINGMFDRIERGPVLR
jgi:hypothetical protein